MGCHGLLTHGNRVIGHPDRRTTARQRFVFYCRESVPQLGVYATARSSPAGWSTTTSMGHDDTKVARLQRVFPKKQRADDGAWRYGSQWETILADRQKVAAEKRAAREAKKAAKTAEAALETAAAEAPA
jgi:hypothetical protein